LIAIDGADGVGKSALASWLAWQLGMPAVHLDMFMVRDSDPLQWRADELKRIIGSRVESGNPVIVEGVLVLDALEQISRRPDFMIFIRGEGSHCLEGRLCDYRLRRDPQTASHFCLDGFEERPHPTELE
jgi:uridine kinase